MILPILLLSFVALSFGQRLQALPQQPTTTPVPILKQVNQQNEDGSFTYGYENADGTYKIETRNVDGQVQGKYGYYDNEGTLREIEYGANKHGFNPSGTGINIPPLRIPTGNDAIDDDDGSYRPPGPGKDGAYVPELYEQPQQQEQSQFQQPQIFQQRPRAQRPRGQRPRPQFQQQEYIQPQQQYQQVPQQQYQFQPYQQQAPQQPQLQQQYTYQGHPASNIDINSGAYQLNYSG